MSANTVISVKEIPVLGEKRFEHVSKATIIRWIEELNQIRRAHPDIDTKLCILTQAVCPGVLKMMRLTLVKAADNFVEITYPANVSTTSITAAAIAARQAFHDKWLDALRKLCSVEDQTAIIVKIQNVKLSPWTNGGRLTLENVMYWATNLAKLFEDEAQAIEKVNGKEVLSAVKRGMPIEVRQVVENSKPADLAVVGSYQRYVGIPGRKNCRDCSRLWRSRPCNACYRRQEGFQGYVKIPPKPKSEPKNWRQRRW